MAFNINELIDRVARGETPQEVLENVKNADVDALIERVVSGETPESVLAHAVQEQRLDLRDWIRDNRREIDAEILRVCSNCQIDDDEERRLWVLNHEPLFDLARSRGVDLT